MKTRIAYLEGPKNIYLVEKDLKVNDDEIIVKTEQASICGTDKMFYNGKIPPDQQYPMLLGHEGGGEVVEVGPKVKKYKPGDKVISFGQYHTFSDYFKSNETFLQPVPVGMEMRYAALGEPVACAVYSAMNTGVNLGDYVLVLGLGFAGQIQVQGAKAKGAYRVIGVDMLEGKLKLAKDLGADYVLNANADNLLGKIMEITGGKGADVVIEAAGSEESMNLANQAVKHNGIISIYSWITEPITLNISRWHNNSLEIRNTGLVHHTPEERYIWTPQALRPIQQGMIKIEPLISAEFKLAEIDKAFKAVTESSSLIKVLIKP